MIFCLENRNYANNCFMNVVVQNIWHINGFKYILKDTIIAAERLDKNVDDPVMFELAQLLKKVKESKEGSTHSAADLKQAILTSMFGGNFDWNE